MDQQERCMECKSVKTNTAKTIDLLPCTTPRAISRSSYARHAVMCRGIQDINRAVSWLAMPGYLSTQSTAVGDDGNNSIVQMVEG